MAGRSRNKLRRGFTTGTAAAAAAKGALIALLTGQVPRQVGIDLLTGERITIAVEHCERIAPKCAVCTVIKDAGDDPDITHGARIGANVSLAGADKAEVFITGGVGIGQVTRPGLEIAPGRAAINPGPQRMIRQAVAGVLAAQQCTDSISVEVFAPDGAELARHTLNKRLGIVGGISILGTTGVVKPMSHQAYVATIRSAMAVARASGLTRVVLTTGRRSERFAQQRYRQIPEAGFVQIGDYFEKAMSMAARQGFDEALLCVFFGKAVKMAQGIAHTHARSARLSLKRLARWTLQITGNHHMARQVAAANTARHALELIKHQPDVVNRVGCEMISAAIRFGGNPMRVAGVIFGFDGKVVFRSDGNSLL